MRRVLRLCSITVAIVVLAVSCTDDREPEATPTATTSPAASAATDTSHATSEPPSATASATESPTPAASPSATSTHDHATPAASSVPPKDDAVVVDIKVAGGKVTTAKKRVEIDKGAKVRLVITSDVKDHVHVHVYDLMKDVAPGVPTTIEFEAKIATEAEVELEDSKLKLVELRIR